jgi:hypothetical protein
MANFQKAPVSLLQSSPASLKKKIVEILMRPGTYSLFDEKGYAPKVPVGNDTWKGQQARIVTLWGEDDTGNPLVVTAADPIVEVTPMSDKPIGNHLWGYIVEVKPGVTEGATKLFARTAADAPGKPAGTDHAMALTVTILPETAASGVPFPVDGGATANATSVGIINECNRQGLNWPAQIAYVLATVQWEAAGTWRPVREGTRLDAQTEKWRRKLSYYPYYGRGYVQLTHLAGYARYTRPAVDLVYDPDLVMQGDIALGVLINGMKMGAFGHRLDQHVNGTKTDFAKARQVVNAMDHAQEIANLAQGWLNKLSTAVYP